MKDFKEYVENQMADFETIKQYIVGATNRLILASPEEIEALRPQIMKLKETLDRIIG